MHRESSRAAAGICSFALPARDRSSANHTCAVPRVSHVASVMGEAPAATPPPIGALGASPPAATTSPLLTFGGGRLAGRNLRQKVVDELKNVRARKSPAHKEKLMARGSAFPLMPPPLELNDTVGDDDEGDVDAQAGGGKNARGGGCSICERSFTVFRPKHTCRMCAQKICDDCSRNRMKLHRRLERKRGSRLCDPCARSYMHADVGSEEDAMGPFPDASPPLVAAHSDDPLLRQPDGDKPPTAGTTAAAAAVRGLPRCRSVPPNCKKLTDVSHAPDTTRAGTSTGAAAVPHKEPSDGARLVPTRHDERRACIHLSHLRSRHWLSLLLVAVLVLLRVIIYGRSAGVAVATSADARGSSRAPLLPYSFVERALDTLLSMHTLGTYLLGLVLFDELSRPRSGHRTAKKAHMRRRRRRRVSTSSRGRASSGTAGAPDAAAPLSPSTSQDEDLEVTVIEHKLDDEDVTVEKLVACLEDGVRNRAPDGDLSLQCFMGTCNVICGFLGVFGRATSFAGSTVGAYFTSIDHNLETWTEPPASSASWKEQSVKAVIEHEVGLRVADVGGKKKPSCSRCLLRLLWFIQFVEACVRLTLLDSTDDNCYGGASRAYEETLGKRHPWLVRKGVNTALGSIPTRSHILAELHKGDGEALVPLRKAHGELLRVIAELKVVFEAHGLTDLK